MTNQDRAFSRRIFLGGAGVTAAGALAACSFDDGPATGGGEGSGDGGADTSATARLRVYGDVLDSLDPHYVNDALYYVAAGLLEGLVLSNEDVTDVVPGAAESWEVSEDRLTYTFTMREGATWSNGDPITASDAEWSFRRVLTPTGAGSTYTTGSSSYLPGLGIKGAEEFMAGALEGWEEVGVTAPDDQTVVIELEVPNADFLIGMSHYSMLLVHPGSVEEHGADWMVPENWVGNGPYLPANWDPTTALRLESNEAYWDYESLQLHSIELVLAMDPTAAQVSFQSGDLDITIANEQAEEDPGLADNLVTVDGFSVHHIRFMYGGHESMRDARVRRALSMAIDREAIVALRPTASEAGTSLVPGNVVQGWDDSLAVEYDVDRARSLMREAGVDNVPNIRLQSNAEEPWHAVLLDGWREAFDVEVSQDVFEAGVHSESLEQPVEDDSVLHVRPGSFGGISTMNNWVSNIFGPELVMQSSMLIDDLLDFRELQDDDSIEGAEKAAVLEEFMRENSDPETVRLADLVTEAQRTSDPDEQLARFIEAAQVREESAWVLPVAWVATSFLVSDRIAGFAPRPSPERAYYKYLSIQSDS